MVKPAGRKDIPGKPLAYGTTDSFLSHFNLNSLEDLPNSEELMAAGLIDSRVDSSIFGTSKFVKEEDSEKENIFTNIDDMINDTLDPKEQDNDDEDEEDDDDEDEDSEEDEDSDKRK